MLFATQGGLMVTNLFAYCYNNPVSFADPTGHIAIVINIAFLGIAICAVAMVSVLSVYLSTPQFQQSWRSLCWSLSRSLSQLWNRLTVLFQSVSKIVAKALEKNIAKTKEIIRRQQNKNRYWIASKVTFNRKGVHRTTYFPCAPIPGAAAATYVRAGGDVFASSQSAAKRLAITAGFSAPPVGPEIHGGVGYFWHFHANRRRGGHIFFLR